MVLRMASTRSFRAAKLNRNAQVYSAACVSPFVLIGTLILVISLVRLDLQGIVFALVAFLLATLTAMAMVKLFMSSRLVVDYEHKTVTISNYLIFNRTLAFDELDEGVYGLKHSFFGVTLVGRRRQSGTERIQVTALSLLYGDDKSGPYYYQDLPKPFDEPGVEIEPWTEVSWSESFLRAMMLRR